MVLAHVAAAVGTSLNVLYLWPQVVRGSRSTAGLSGQTCVLGLLGRTSWLVYAAITAQAGLLIGQVFPALAYAVLIVLLLLRDHGQRRRILMALLLGGLLVAASTVRTEALAVTAGVVAAVVALPQLVTALRTRHLNGVSATSYALGAAASCAWILYSATEPDIWVALPHLVLGPTNLAVAVRVVHAHRHQGHRA